MDGRVAGVGGVGWRLVVKEGGGSQVSKDFDPTFLQMEPTGVNMVPMGAPRVSQNTHEHPWLEGDPNHVSKRAPPDLKCSQPVPNCANDGSKSNPKTPKSPRGCMGCPQHVPTGAPMGLTLEVTSAKMVPSGHQ